MPAAIIIALLAAPSLGALFVLALGGWLDWLPGALAAAGIALLLAFIAWPPLRRLRRLAARIEGLAAGTSAEPADPGFLTRDLEAAVLHAGRELDRRRRETDAALDLGLAILDRLPMPLLLLDASRRLARVNPAAELLLGQGIAGRDLTAVLRDPGLMEAVDEALAGGPGRAVEFVVPVPVERHLSARVEPLRQAEGPAALVALHDLTAIAQAQRLRMDFIANVSHELRTPLATLVGFIETLRGPAREDAEARERFLAIMHDQGRRMARLVADLLSLSRVELHEHTPPTGRVNLAAVLQGVADTLQIKAEQKGMRIELGVSPPGPSEAPGPLAALPPAVGDADELAQVFQNLIDNAIKYGREDTKIRVAGWVAEPGRVAVAVMDEGEGIGRLHLPRLTERFYRVDTARSRDLGGTGLGLAIVKHILLRHRGALKIDSIEGKGSTFTVILPVDSASPTP